MSLQDRKCTGNETLRRVHLTTVTIGKALSINILSVCLYSCSSSAHAQHYIVICGMSGFTVRFHAIS